MDSARIEVDIEMLWLRNMPRMRDQPRRINTIFHPAPAVGSRNLQPGRRI